MLIKDCINLFNNKQRKFPTMTSNFVGKIIGSTVENPNIYKRTTLNGGTTSLITPTALSGWAEAAQASYDAIKILDGAPAGSSTTVNAQISQHVFQFDIIEIFKRNTGYYPPGIDRATQATVLKNVINALNINWTGFGSSPLGNKAYLTIFKSTNWHGSALTNTANSPTLISATSAYWGTIGTLIDSNGFVYLIAYSDASNGTIASSINTDYVEMKIIF